MWFLGEECCAPHSSSKEPNDKAKDEGAKEGEQQQQNLRVISTAEALRILVSSDLNGGRFPQQQQGNKHMMPRGVKRPFGQDAVNSTTTTTIDSLAQCKEALAPFAMHRTSIAAHVHHMSAAAPPIRPIRTGHTDLDEALDGGIQIGKITAVCGRAHCGKSFFVTRLAAAVLTSHFSTATQQQPPPPFNVLLIRHLNDPNDAIATRIANAVSELLIPGRGGSVSNSSHDNQQLLCDCLQRCTIASASNPNELLQLLSLRLNQSKCSSDSSNMAAPLMIIIDSFSAIFSNVFVSPAAQQISVLEVKTLLNQIFAQAAGRNVACAAVITLFAAVGDDDHRRAVGGGSSSGGLCLTPLSLTAENFPPAQGVSLSPTGGAVMATVPHVLAYLHTEFAHEASDDDNGDGDHYPQLQTVVYWYVVRGCARNSIHFKL